MHVAADRYGYQGIHNVMQGIWQASDFLYVSFKHEPRYLSFAYTFIDLGLLNMFKRPSHASHEA